MAPSPGDRFGPYEIVAPIGSGGMGTVYRALDTRLDREVAIKFCHERFSERFDKEARVIAALNHPHICTLYDVGPNYLVMEYIAGAPLKGPLPADLTLQLAAQICDALEAAHDKGIIHRDLKPANILVTKSGVKLLDFGLAKLTAASPGQDDRTATATQAGAVAGTAAYMSPEQAQGQALDARSDIFSYGAVLYELLTGRRAFQRDSWAATLAGILYEDPSPPPHHGGLEEVVGRCLRKDKNQRPRNMVEVRAMLQRCSSPPLEPHDREKPSIAVLPFENLSPDKENEYFGDGLAEEILNGLTRVPGLRVIARTSAFAFRARGITVQEIGARLKVGTVLEGSVRKAGNRIRVTVQLIRVMDESHLWSERYDRDLIDIFALQDEISQAIVEALKIKLTGPPRSLAADRYTENVEAYNLYLKGRFHLYKMTGDEVAAGLKLMEQAVAIDPDYAPAHVELAHHELMLAFAGVTAPPTFIPRCKAALSRIVARFDECAEAHAVLGLLLGVCEYRWEEAGRELGRARELNPASPLAHTLTATLLAGQNRLDEALLYSRRAVDLDPLSPFFNHALSILLAFAKQPAPAIEYGRAALEVQPDSWLAFSSLGGAYGAAGRWDEAVDWLEKARAHAPVENWVSGWLASAYMHVGRRAKAEQILAGLTLRRQGTYVSATALGMACAALGDVAGAFTWLEKAMSESDPILYFLKIDPVFDGLRSHARYRELLRAMNL